MSYEFKPRVDVFTHIDYDAAEIVQEVRDIQGRYMLTVVRTQEAQIRDALIKLGWTPPANT